MAIDFKRPVIPNTPLAHIVEKYEQQGSYLFTRDEVGLLLDAVHASRNTNIMFVLREARGAPQSRVWNAYQGEDNAVPDAISRLFDTWRALDKRDENGE